MGMKNSVCHACSWIEFRTEAAGSRDVSWLDGGWAVRWWDLSLQPDLSVSPITLWTHTLGDLKHSSAFLGPRQSKQDVTSVLHLLLNEKNQHLELSPIPRDPALLVLNQPWCAGTPVMSQLASEIWDRHCYIQPLSKKIVLTFQKCLKQMRKEGRGSVGLLAIGYTCWVYASMSGWI